LQVGDEAEAPLLVQVPADGVVALDTDIAAPGPQATLTLRLLGPDRRVLSENVYAKGHFRP
jgi:hypothetical protein